MSMMVSFVLSFFPRDVLDEILNLIESVSEDFPSYSSIAHSLSLLNSYWNLIGFGPIPILSCCFASISRMSHFYSIGAGCLGPIP